MIFISKNNNLFKFRKYKKFEGDKSVRHPKLIVDETNKEFGYMGLTHQKKRGHHSNFPLLDNPELIYSKGKIIRKKENSYLRDEIEYDKKNKFSDPLDSYDLSSRDKYRVIYHVIDLKNKKKK